MRAEFEQFRFGFKRRGCRLIGAFFNEDDFVNQVKLAARQEIQQVGNIVFGHIASYDPATNRARFIIPSNADENGGYVLTGWAPLGTMMGGNNWGIQCAPLGGATVQNPTNGELCVITFLDRTSGVIASAMMVFNQANLAPNQQLAAGELLLKSQVGASAYFKKDGSITLTDEDGDTFALDGQGHINANPKTSFVITVGDVVTTIDNTGVKTQGDVVAGEGGSDQVSLQNHVQSNVTPGSGESGPPVAGT